MSDPAVETRLNRTCEGCRKRKIKCIPDVDATGRCVRCTKLGIDCVFNAPAIKKKRKRKETRIRELEEKLEQVQQSLEQSSAQWTPSTSEDSPVPASTDNSSLTRIGTLVTCPCHASCEDDPVSRGIVEESLADELCANFCTEVLPHYPMVLPPAPISWRTFREHRPALFRAILAAASSAYAPQLWKPLFENVERHVMEQAMIKGKKSLDLIQAALVLAIWSHPPKRFQDLNFGQFVNLAATMVMDLRSSNEPQYHTPFDCVTHPAGEILEVARTFSACYFLCSSIAMSFRRPSTLPHGSWVQDCIEILDSAATAHIGDRRLAAWVRLQRLAEETLAMAGLDGCLSVNSTDARTRLILRGGFERVQSWKRALAENVMHDTLNIHHHIILLNLSEPGLHDNHRIQDFRSPYAIHTQPPAIQAFTLDSPHFIDARIECVNIAREIINIILQISAESLRQKPVIVFTRIMYAVVVIVKLEVFKSNYESMHMPQIQSAVELLGQVLNKLASAAEGSRFRVPATFHAVLRRLLSQCAESYSRQHDQNKIIEPLVNLELEDPISGNLIPVAKQSSLPPPAEHLLGLRPPHPEAEFLPYPFSSFENYVGLESENFAATMFWDSFLGDTPF